jgi:hypothetical protein
LVLLGRHGFLPSSIEALNDCLKLLATRSIIGAAMTPLKLTGDGVDGDGVDGVHKVDESTETYEAKRSALPMPRLKQ